MHRQLLSVRGLPEPQPLEHRGPYGDHHPALENAASNFTHEAEPALSRFAETSPTPLTHGIRAARNVSAKATQQVTGAE